MREAHVRNSINYEMDTENRGSILAWERGPRAGEIPGNAGRPGRNAFLEPAEFTPGPNGRVGGNDPMNTNDWDGCFGGEETVQ